MPKHKPALCPHGFPVADHPPNCSADWEDDGPPHRGSLCITTEGWLCRYAGGHSSGHAPYVEGEYLRRRTTAPGDAATTPIGDPS